MAKDNTPQYLKQQIRLVQITIKELLELLREIQRQRLLQRKYERLNETVYDSRDPVAMYERDVMRIQTDPTRYKVYRCHDNDNIEAVKGILRSQDIPVTFQDARSYGQGGAFVFDKKHEETFLNAVDEYNKALQGLTNEEDREAYREKMSEIGRNGKDDRERNPWPGEDKESNQDKSNKIPKGYKVYRCTDDDRANDLRKLCREENIDFKFIKDDKNPGGAFLIKKEDEEKFLTAVAGYEKKRKEAENNKKDVVDEVEYDDDDEIVSSKAEKKEKSKDSEDKENAPETHENGQESSLDDLEDESKDSDERGDNNTSSDEREDNGSEQNDAVENESEEQECSSEDAEKAESRMEAEEKAEEAREELRESLENPEDLEDNLQMGQENQEQKENASDIDGHETEDEYPEELNDVEESVEESAKNIEEAEQPEADFVETPEEINDDAWLDQDQEETSDSNEHDSEDKYPKESYEDDTSIEDIIEELEQSDAELESPEDVIDNSWLDENQEENSNATEYDVEDKYPEEPYKEDVSVDESVEETEHPEADFTVNPEDVNNNSWLDQDQDEIYDSNAPSTEDEYPEESYKEDVSSKESVENAEQPETNFISNPEDVNNSSWLGQEQGNSEFAGNEYTEDNDYPTEQGLFNNEYADAKTEPGNGPELQTASFVENPEDFNNNAWINQATNGVDNYPDQNTNNVASEQPVNVDNSSGFENTHVNESANNFNDNFADAFAANNINQTAEANHSFIDDFNQTENNDQNTQNNFINTAEYAAGAAASAMTAAGSTNTESFAAEQQSSLYQGGVNNNQGFQNNPDNANNVSVNGTNNNFIDNVGNQTSQPVGTDFVNSFNSQNADTTGVGISGSGSTFNDNNQRGFSNVGVNNNNNNNTGAEVYTGNHFNHNNENANAGNAGFTEHQNSGNNTFNASEQTQNVGVQSGNMGFENTFNNQNTETAGVNNVTNTFISSTNGQSGNADIGNTFNNQASASGVDSSGGRTVNDNNQLWTSPAGANNNNNSGSEIYTGDHFKHDVAETTNANSPVSQNNAGINAPTVGVNNNMKPAESGNVSFASSFGSNVNELEVYDAGNAFDVDPYGGIIDHKSLVKTPTDLAKTAMEGGDKNFAKKGLKEFKSSGGGDALTMSTYTLTDKLSHGVTEGNLTNKTMKAFDDALGKEDKDLLLDIFGAKDKSADKQLDTLTNLMEQGHLISKNKLTGKYEAKGTEWEYNKPVTPIGRHSANKTAQVLADDKTARAHYATSGEYTASQIKKKAAEKGKFISDKKAKELAGKLNEVAEEAALRKDIVKIGKKAGGKYIKTAMAAADDPNNFAVQEVKGIRSKWQTGKQAIDIARQGRAILANQFKGRAERQIVLNERIMNKTVDVKTYKKALKKYNKYEKKLNKYDTVLEKIEKKRENAKKGIPKRIKDAAADRIKKTKAYGELKSVGGKLKGKVLKLKPVRIVRGGLDAAKTALGIGMSAKDFAAVGGNPVVFAVKKLAEILIDLITNLTQLAEKVKKTFVGILAGITIMAVISCSGAMIFGGLLMGIGTFFSTFGTMFDINEKDEPDTASDEDIKNSTYGIVYEELRTEETTWFKNLIQEMSNKQYMSVSDTSYTDTSNLGAQMGTITGGQSGASGQVTDSTPPTNLAVIKNAGQAPIAATEAEVFLLAQVIYNEAGAESYESQVGVAEVIINRVNSSKFPGKTLTAVINQKGQFSDLARAKNFSAAKVAAQIPIARAAISGSLRIFNNPNILFFCNPKYVKGLKVTAATRKDWKGCGTWYAGISDTAFYYGNNNATNEDHGFYGQVTPQTTVKSAEDYATQNLGTTYQNGGFKGPTPFEGAPEEAYKNITIIDGEQSLVFRDANGNYGCKSNLRQILSMAMVAQEQTDNFEDNVDEETFDLITSNSILDKIKGVFSIVTKAVEGAVNAIKNFFTSAVEKIFPSFKNWWEHHEAKKRAKVVMAYCKPLFDMSHQNEFSEDMSIHPTLRTLKNAGITREEYDGEICNGNEAQNADAVDAHNGYGCMSYNKFFYRDDNDTDVSLSENGSLVMEVQPAGFITGDNGVIPCSTPDGNADTFLARLDANPDCWDVSVGDEYESDSGAGGHSGSTVIDNAVGGSHRYSVSGKGGSYTVTVQLARHVSRDSDGDIDEIWYDLCDVTVTHHCNGNHTGYYCGGHLDNNVQSVITTWTKAQEEQIQGEYFSKVSDTTTYKIAKDYAAPSNEELRNAHDLFDIDMLITHMEGTVYQEKDSEGNLIQFEGWTLDNMDLATSKFADDWKNLYPGIDWDDNITVSADEISSGTVGGGASGQGSTNTSGKTLSDAEITAALELAMSQIPDTDPIKADREVAMKTALYYVGKVAYNQDFHQSKLTVGGKNDCSGYASQCWYNKLHTVYTTVSFKQAFKGIMRPFTDGQCTPGDILLHYSKENHALIYMGKDSSGHNISVDESRPCSMYRNRSESYYSECYYIPMSRLG